MTGYGPDARSTSRGSILVLTPRFPFPLLAGDAIRIFQVCSALSEEWDLTLLSICQTREELVQPLPAGSPFSRVHRVFLPRWQSYLQAAIAAVSGEALQVAYYRSGKFRQAVDELAAGHQVMLCHLLRTAPYASGFNGPRILELTDHLPLTYQRAMSLARGSGGLLRMAYRLESRRISAVQRRWAPHFDLVSFVSDVDRVLFEGEISAGAGKTIHFPVSVDLSARPFKSGRDGLRIAFVGNLRTLQNRDAVQFFCREVLPLVRSRLPTATLKVVGAVDPAFARDMSRDGAVTFTGVVPSVADALADCCIGVCPVRIAAGMQNKLLDYMSVGLPTVTTTQGAEGLLLRDREHALVADDPVGLADAAVRLLGDATLRGSVAAAARELIETEYALETNTRKLRDRMRDLIDGFSRPRARW